MPAHALSIIANPSPASFSHAAAAAAARVLRVHGYEVIERDLYAERFDPVHRSSEQGNRSADDDVIQAHRADLLRADLILVFHPNWWGQPPAVLKGWLDRVFAPGVAYDYPPGVGPEGIPVGLLRARAALVINTSNTPMERELAEFGDPLEALWRNCVFKLCGVERFERRMFAPVVSSAVSERQRWLEEVETLVARCASREAIEVATR